MRTKKSTVLDFLGKRDIVMLSCSTAVMVEMELYFCFCFLFGVDQ